MISLSLFSLETPCPFPVSGKKDYGFKWGLTGWASCSKKTMCLETAHRQTDSRQQKSLTVEGHSCISLQSRRASGRLSPKLCPALDVAAAVCCPSLGATCSWLSVWLQAGILASMKALLCLPSLGPSVRSPPLSFGEGTASGSFSVPPPARNHQR